MKPAPDVAQPSRAYLARLAERRLATARVVLIGAPGSGKTNVGRRLGACLGVPHVDVDARIEQQQDRLIREIFADDGEAHFRELERDATLAALSEDAVLSLGGGAVMTPAIRDALAGHRVVWLKRFRCTTP